MLLGDKFNLPKYQNPTSNVETTGDNADNIWCPILIYDLELNPTQKYSSMLGVNLWVAETTNNFIGTAPKSASLSMKPIQSPVLPIKPDGDLDHHQVGT